ncbi:hypothetical protein ABB37_07654 [Leptomonas pyrrhocoris]|uniref:Centrosomal protein of 19 kDa n=1 Tax=Leptomonas pyrrhocoris TaxID=157538 RepID=A0A0N0VE31_LEPPY|nr:hypothetical protein ABB37_07654 [Leptomonas pyrrhocoris]KPA76858.1 hypothetical protein ABB37_07654 [Leptomonas pyrrhocoris]|eukprot:XP_015655297.1 hypothetical protein ABB37_07654 [Leptomonas pyrrhocoris]
MERKHSRSPTSEVTSCNDLGAELWALVYHLFAKYKDNCTLAVRELGLRTHHEFESGSSALFPRSPADVKRSVWYADMSAAYSALREDLHQTHLADVTEATDLVLSLYPDGCNVSEYAEAVRTSAAVLPCTVPSDMIDFFVSKKGDEFKADGVHVVAGEALAKDVIEGLMFSALLPRQWWCARFAAVARARRVGVKGSPPTLFIEYERPPGVVHVRRIHLGSHLRENTPTVHLARRLATTHESLLSEAQFQSLLLRCQRLMRHSPATASPATTRSSPLPAATVSAAPMQQPATSPAATESSDGDRAKSTKPQKADLGLLYRDPDAALQNVDLNDADDVTLREFKEVMNEGFNKNVIKPGDPGYVYDKRLEVTKSAQQSEWDDDSD